MSTFAFLQELKKHSKFVSPVAFAMGGCISRENGQFYYDRGTGSWQWFWDGSWWVWHPFYTVDPDDPDADRFHMNDYGGAWISEDGDVWRGVDPNVWARAYATRIAWRRRQDFVRYQLVRRGLRQLIPEALVENVLGFGIDGTPVQPLPDAAADALKSFQDLIDKIVL